MTERPATIKPLAEFAPLAELDGVEFGKRVFYPLLVVELSRASLHTVTPTTPTPDPVPHARAEHGEPVVIPLKPRCSTRELSVIIGRGLAADVVLPLETISREHAQLSEGPSGQLFLVDLGSRNGTFINGARLVTRQVYLARDGDRVKLGDVEGTLLMPDAFHELLKSRPSGK